MICTARRDGQSHDKSTPRRVASPPTPSVSRPGPITPPGDTGTRVPRSRRARTFRASGLALTARAGARPHRSCSSSPPTGCELGGWCARASPSLSGWSPRSALSDWRDYRRLEGLLDVGRRATLDGPARRASRRFTAAGCRGCGSGGWRSPRVPARPRRQDAARPALPRGRRVPPAGQPPAQRALRRFLFFAHKGHVRRRQPTRPPA